MELEVSDRIVVVGAAVVSEVATADETGSEVFSGSDEVISIVVDAFNVDGVVNVLSVVVVANELLVDNALVEFVVSGEIMVVVAASSDEDVESSVTVDEVDGNTLVITIVLVLVEDSVEVMTVVDVAISKFGKEISSNATDMNRESGSSLEASVQSRTICSTPFALGLV